MANVDIRYGLTSRVVRATLIEQNGSAANLSAGGTVVTLHLRGVRKTANAWTRTATIVDANTGKVSYAIVAGDFDADKFQPGESYFAWWSAQPTPAGSDTGNYPEAGFDTWTVTF